VDGVLLMNGLELDESLLTGESEPVTKQLGEEVLSGSFVVAGNGRMQATRIGNKAYARTVAAEARKFVLARSELRDGIDRILWYVTWCRPLFC
jgi:cation-transporting ATPase E